MEELKKRQEGDAWDDHEEAASSQVLVLVLHSRGTCQIGYDLLCTVPPDVDERNSNVTLVFPKKMFTFENHCTWQGVIYIVRGIVGAPQYILTQSIMLLVQRRKEYPLLSKAVNCVPVRNISLSST